MCFGTTGSISLHRNATAATAAAKSGIYSPFALNATGLKPLSRSPAARKVQRRGRRGWFLTDWKAATEWEAKSFSWQRQSRSINFTLSTKIKQDPKSFCDFWAAFCIGQDFFWVCLHRHFIQRRDLKASIYPQKAVQINLLKSTHIYTPTRASLLPSPLFLRCLEMLAAR